MFSTFLKERDCFDFNAALSSNSKQHLMKLCGKSYIKVLLIEMDKNILVLMCTFRYICLCKIIFPYKPLEPRAGTGLIMMAYCLITGSH